MIFVVIMGLFTLMILVIPVIWGVADSRRHSKALTAYFQAINDAYESERKERRRQLYEYYHRAH